MLTKTMDKRKADDGTPKADLIDRAIDRSVRRMLDVDPRADLRARVIERIERPQRAFHWWLVAPVAAAAVIVLAVVLWPPKEPLPTRAVTQIALRPADTRAPALLRHAADRPNSPPRRPNAARQDRRVATAVVADAAPPTIELEPLSEIEAISTPPVPLQALDTQRIAPPLLAPLAQIEIELVNPSAGRN